MEAEPTNAENGSDHIANDEEGIYIHCPRQPLFKVMA